MTTPRRLSDLNPHLLCVLCGGYFIDATTISECGHSFCRSCIFKHLESGKFCPICDVQLNRVKPVFSTREDKALQRLVYKMVPGLYQRELQRRREFYESAQVKQMADSQADYRHDMGRMEPYTFYTPEENFGLSLEYYDRAKIEGDRLAGTAPEEHSDEAERRYLKCPAGVTVGHLKKFIRMKYGLKPEHCVDIFYNNRIIPESFTLIDVADTFNWNKITSMRFGFQILELHPVTVSNPDPDMMAEVVYDQVVALETPSSSFIEEPEEKRKHLSRLDVGNKKRKRSTSSKESNDREYEPKKALIDVERRPSKMRNHTVGNKTNQAKRNNYGKSTVSAQEEMNETSVYSSKEEKDNESKSPEHIEQLVPEEDGVDAKSEEISQTVDSIEEEIMGLVGDGSKDIEEVLARDDPSQDFVLQDQQEMDVNEDLEEDDDEGRLRICDPEEIAEEKSNEENNEEQISPEPIQSKVLEERLEKFIEEEVEVVRKESKSRRKNKKAKHHHRHKRDYSPAPEATIVSDDNNDIMKLKVKINRGESESTLARQKSKQEDHLKSSTVNDGHTSPRQLKHRSYISNEDADNNSLQSPSHSNLDEDSRNSQSTDDHDARSVASSKEGQDEFSTHKNVSLHNGAFTREESCTSVKTQELKEKLLQMRQVRRKSLHKILSSNKHSAEVLNKNSNSEDVSKSSPKPPILLTSSTSSLIVSKVTAEEKMMMITNNNLENKTPSLEIIMVNKPNSVSKGSELKTHETAYKHKALGSGMPIVKLTKTNFPPSMLTKQSSISVSAFKNNIEVSAKNQDKPNGPRINEKKRESFGVLDLSGKSTRSCESSPASEGSNSPSHTIAPQPLINRHLASVDSSRRSSTNSPPISSPVAKGSPTRMIQHHPSSLWNLMTLTETAVQMRNLNVNKPTKSPLHKHSLSSSSPSKSPSRGSPTQLKIPTPNISLGGKLNRPKPPTSSSSYMNNGLPVGVHKPLMNIAQSPRPNSTFSGIFPNQSSAIAKKQAGINGRNIRSPPPGIPISKLYEMSKKYDIEMITRGLSSKNKTAAGISSS